MLLTSVIIVLREILEAALLIATLLAAIRSSGIGYHWLRMSISAGIVGALLFAWQLRWISNLNEGLGYELSNAALQVLIYIVILVLISQLFKLYLCPEKNHKPLLFFMGLALSLSMVREGSEILIYFSSFFHHQEGLSSGVIGSIIGAGVGFSFGALFYFLLSALRQSLALIVALGLLVLIGASMCSQASMLMMQADWLPSQPPLWNTSSWIAEPSITGQLLYALIGYEATPSPLQVGIYTGSVFISLLIALVAYHFYSSASHREVNIEP
ncbi:MAG: FTR1 family iron permease [Gammaproteobacteria bacterium]|nr:FTR1 family iron permease [Gammaproteobacteria bacterium]MBQ0838805.1 FTR1 family iron permease [Gammaproteobacteria bacterium]